MKFRCWEFVQPLHNFTLCHLWLVSGNLLQIGYTHISIYIHIYIVSKGNTVSAPSLNCSYCCHVALDFVDATVMPRVVISFFVLFSMAYCCWNGLCGSTKRVLNSCPTSHSQKIVSQYEEKLLVLVGATISVECWFVYLLNNFLALYTINERTY